jgi:type II secretory pathway predicted ATPase ExeA
MYETHFGLRRRPFPATPDTDCYYPATGHEHALAQLAQGLQDQEGVLLLTGPPGTGKTLLGQRLIEQTGHDGAHAFLTNSHVGGPPGLLQAILYDLGQPYQGHSEQELRLALTDVLLKGFADHRPTLLIVDEAQHLTLDLLEELRLLGNLEGPPGRALQVVLLAQEPFREMLHQSVLASLKQRLGAHASLRPFDVHEAADYLVHHLRIAGGQPDAIMTDEALEVIARGAQGLPRLLNRAAHTALRLAHQAGAQAVDAEVALEALEVHGLGEADSACEEIHQSIATEVAAEPGVIALESAPGIEHAKGRGRRPKLPA